MEAIKEYFHVVLFIMLYKVVLTLKSVGFSSPEAALLLISTKNRNLWEGPTQEVWDFSEFRVTLCKFRVKSDNLIG